MPYRLSAPACAAYHASKFPNLYARALACGIICSILNEQISEFVCLGARLRRYLQHTERANFRICMPERSLVPPSAAYHTGNFQNLYACVRRFAAFFGIPNGQIFDFVC